MKKYINLCIILTLASLLSISCHKNDDDTTDGENTENPGGTDNPDPANNPDILPAPEIPVNPNFPTELTSVKIDEAHFPDPVFRQLLLGRTYDQNGDGTLDKDELILLRNIHCEGMGVKSLAGIEYLMELRGIYCQDNEIEDWDLSNNKLLTGIWCSGNKFTSLDFSANRELLWVYCHDNQLTSLIVKYNPKMAYIECNTNPLTELDVTHNPELEHLMCGTCQLTSLDLSHNPKLQHLDAFQNQFTSLDLSNNPMMKRLDIWNNPDLGDIKISQMPGLQTYNCAKTGITKLDVTHSPELNKLICSYNDISELDLSNNPKLIILECQDNSLKKLDLSHNPNLRFLWAAHNQLTSIDISNNPYLIKAYKEGSYEKSAYGESEEWVVDLGGDVSTGDDNKLYFWIDVELAINAKSNGTPAAEERYSELDPGVKESDCLTRGYVVNYLYKMAGSPNVGGHKSSYLDVAGNKYEAALIWGELRKLYMGYPEFLGDYCSPDKWVTRQDLMFMLMRYAEAFGLKRDIDFGRSDEYIDYYDIDYDHWEAVCWSATWNIIEGKGESGAPKSEQRIDPYGRVTQSDLDAAIKRLQEVNN